MEKSEDCEKFLSRYKDDIAQHAQSLRRLLLKCLPGITEQVDLPAKMIAYSFGPKYQDLICVIIPSQKGLKLGFNRGTMLPDPSSLLVGNGKISRYVEIKTLAQIKSQEFENLIFAALECYQGNKNLI